MPGRDTVLVSIRKTTAFWGALTVGVGTLFFVPGWRRPVTVDPGRRSVRLEIAGCGLAPDRVGSGIAVADGLVVTVAHLVAEAETVRVRTGLGAVEAPIVAIDLKRDLALLHVEGARFPDLATAEAKVGDTGQIVGGVTATSIGYTVEGRVALTIEEVLGTSRHRRLGYELLAETGEGDSGAGAYDLQGRLVGVVFATGRNGESTWLTASSEMTDFLDRHRGDRAPLVCDPGRSRLRRLNHPRPAAALPCRRTWAPCRRFRLPPSRR